MDYILDIILVIPLAWGLVRGLYKGFLMSVGSLLGLIIGIYVANAYSGQMSEYILQQFVLSPGMAHAISFFVIFAGVTFICFLISKLLDKFFNLVMLSWLNRLLGALFGVLKCALIVSVVLNLVIMVDRYVSFIPEQTKSESVLYEPLQKMVPTILPYVKFYVTGDGKD